MPVDLIIFINHISLIIGSFVYINNQNEKNKIEHYSDKEALDFHNTNKSGKIEIISSKPMTSKRDLALAYSPGVAAPVKAISKIPDLAYDYTTKGNLVAVISNGSAILGLWKFRGSRFKASYGRKSCFI